MTEMLCNHADPTIMHSDLNSCFATIEQQAYPILRNRPLIIAAYETPGGCVLAASIEAKRYGVKTGMRVRDARAMCPGIIVRDPDPEMVRYVHLKLRMILERYATCVQAKSIDEFVMDFSQSAYDENQLVRMGKEIKKRIREDIGEWITCSIGIAPNRFLAKLAAGLQKPDGLEIITQRNLEAVYKTRTLCDLPGISTRFQARLNAQGIQTPTDFLHAKRDVLEHQVFRSICGYYWYMRLRGWEIDAVGESRKSYGQSYALQEKTDEKEELEKLLMKLCEKMGRRLRHHGFHAYGIHVSCIYADMTYWHKGKTQQRAGYTTKELFTAARNLLACQPQRKRVRELSVRCFHLETARQEQLELLDNQRERAYRVQEAVDRANDRWGEYVVVPARMMGAKNVILDRIAFGGVRDLEDVRRSTAV